MNDDEKNKIREQRRAQIDCGVTPETPVVPDTCADIDKDRWAKRTDPCADPIPCDPTVFTKPSAKPTTPETDYDEPAPAVIGNEQVTLPCPDGKFGQTVVIATDLVTSEFDWRTIPDIRPEQLDHISRITDLTPLFSQTTDYIMSWARLSVPQATYVVETVTATKAEVQEAAQFAAYQSLDCWFENATQSMQCPEGALTSKVEGGPDVQYSVTVPAGTFRSYNSQEDADLMALLEAQALLVCIYGNDAVTRSCYPHVDSVDVEIKGNPYSVTSEPNTFFSLDSKADANTLAAAAALAALDCWYENEEFTLHCMAKDREERNITLYGVNKVFTIAAVFGGDPVTIPAGRVISLLSTEAANIEAQALAEGSISCTWKNEEGVFTCDEGANPDKTESGSITLAANTFFSIDTADNVLDQIEGYLGVALQCIYCNDEIPPLCNENSLEYTYGIAANVICANTKEEANTIASGVANRPRLSGASSGSCLYGNDEISVTCADKIPGTELSDFDPNSTLAITIPANSYQIRSTNPTEGKTKAQELAGAAAFAALYCFFSNAGGEFFCADADNVSKNSIGSRSNPVVVPAGTFTSMVSMDEVAAQEKAYAEALLDCYYSNDKIVMYCGEPGTDTMTEVSPEANGSHAHPIIIEADVYQSYVSKDNANQLAKTAARTYLDCFLLSDPKEYTCESLGRGGPGLIPTPPLKFPRGYMRTYISREALESDLLIAANSMLQCFYTNEDQSSPPCPDDQVQIGGGIVPAGTVVSPLSKADADKMAGALATAMTACMDPDDDTISGKDGSPGNDGTQKDCQGTCFGFYS